MIPSATEALRLLRSGDLTSAELVSDQLARIDTCPPSPFRSDSSTASRRSSR